MSKEEEDDGMDDILEVNLEIPFKKIEKLTILNVSYQNDTFEISLTYKLEGLPLQEKKILKRTQLDFIWFLKQLSDRKELPLIPMLKTKSYMNYIVDKIYSNAERKQLQMGTERRVMELSAKRCLKLIAEVTLCFINVNNLDAYKPIFVFISDLYSLYKEPTYWKEESSNLSTLMNGLFSHGRSYFSQSPTQYQFLSEIKAIAQHHSKQFNEFHFNLEQYINNLYKIVTEFMMEKQKIKDKIHQVNSLSFDCLYSIQQIELILVEIQSTILRLATSNSEANAIQTNLKIYCSAVKQEIESMQKRKEQLVINYWAIIGSNALEISLAYDRNVSE